MPLHKLVWIFDNNILKKSVSYHMY